MSTFRNCVAVDFWSDGMWFWNSGERFHVVHVAKGDVALAVKGDCAESKWFSADERAICDLDLTRPWAGIYARHRFTHAFAMVLLVGPGQIGYATAGGVHIAQLGWFLKRYELLPFAKPVDEPEVACVGVAQTEIIKNES